MNPIFAIFESTENEAEFMHDIVACDMRLEDRGVVDPIPAFHACCNAHSPA